MAESTLNRDQIQPDVRINPERAAWGIILLSFALFCILCAVTTIGLQWFFFQSTVSLNVTLQPSKGTTSLRDSVGRADAVLSSRYMRIGDFVGTDTTVERSQTSLVFQDIDRFVAMVTLQESTSLNVRNASRPRFQWGGQDYQIDLFNVTGALEINIADDLSRDIEMNIYSPQGTWVRLGESGHYNVTISSGRVSVTNWRGEAILVVPDSNILPRQIPVGQRAVVNGESGNAIQVSDAPVNLLQNSELTFFESNNGNNEGVSSASMIGWGCTYEPGNSGPRGEHLASVAPDGQRALELLRIGATTTGRTGCNQFVGDTNAGYNVVNFNNLELHISLYIHHQSVSACGIAGTECPLMIEITYIDENDTERVRYQGVYSERNDSVLRCDSCITPILIQKDAWYIYNSGNLFDLLQVPNPDPNLPPIGLRAIKKIRFYASGHDYDVFINDVSLLAWNEEQPVGESANGG